MEYVALLFQIPFKTPRSGSFPTVFCISPLFANEQWQYLLFAMHAYKRLVNLCIFLVFPVVP